MRSAIKVKDELRKYMGPKGARVPRGAVVRLLAVVNGKMGIFEYEGERFNCPVRLLWRLNCEMSSNHTESAVKPHKAKISEKD